MTEASSVPLRVEVITLFPGMIDAPLSQSVLGKAQERGLLQVTSRDLRPYGEGRHRLTDDTPYGGGAGMVMKPEPLVAAIEASREALAVPEVDGSYRPPRVLLMDPQGRPFRQADARRLANESALVFVCGRYEGVDERVRPHVDELISLGDFVLTGGEFAALAVIDAVARLRAGVLGNEASAQVESFADGLLEGPQYTRPVEFRGMRVPDVLMSGDHRRIALWRRKQSLARTLAVRPEVLEQVALDENDRNLLAELEAESARS